jgi:hydrogenase-1 operon protein HyaF
VGIMTAEAPRSLWLDAIRQDLLRHLRRLAADPQVDETLDLANLPLSPQDRDRLRAWLGEGEVSATLNVVGPTQVQETAFAGIWWITHRAPDGRVQLEQINVARMPALLCAQPDDIPDAVLRLATVATEESVHE